MDREKLSRANEIAEQIDYYDEMITNLKSSDCIEFFIREKGSQRQVLSLTGCWGDNSDLFDAAIYSILKEARDRKKTLEDEFESL